MLRLLALATLFVACAAPHSSIAPPSPSVSSAQASASPLVASPQTSAATPSAGSVPASPSPLVHTALQDIAAQPGDLPSGMVACSWSADFVVWAGNVKPTDAAYAQQVLDLWQRLQSGGATGGWVQDVSVSEDACQGFYSGSAGLVQHVTCMVIQFGDAASATNAYSSETSELFGPKVLNGGPTQSGSATGLGPNSIEATPGNLPMITLFAAWQKDAYYVVFIAYGMAISDDRLAVAKIDGRIP